ncbi:MAG: exodeoxyribonuclease VII small subunit [Coriobacteriales bacterium]|jgi:exodeoxyribonuclease VII small subunit|nr:exodeoxyribonuclease VII small subunit [Coriobacteriales bacterium]
MMSEDSSSYGRVRERLEEIVVQIRSKDVPLEKSLDLYEEALRLGSLAAEMIDNTDFSEAELAALAIVDDDQDNVEKPGGLDTDMSEVEEREAAAELEKPGVAEISEDADIEGSTVEPAS